MTKGAETTARKKPRGTYHHGELRRALVDATLAIVRSDGNGAVSLSAAARRVGVSPQASYNHFRDKGELLAAAAEEVVRALAIHMHAAKDAASGALARLEATGVAYVTFACSHAAEFRLLNAPELADKSRHPALLAACRAALAVLLEAIGEGQRAGLVREADPRKLALAAWATVHGVAWLVVDGQIAVSGEAEETPDPARTAKDALRVLFKGLRP